MTTQPTIQDPRTTPVPTRRRRRIAAASIAASTGAAMLAMTIPAAAGADVHARKAPRPVGPRLQAVLDRAVRAPEQAIASVPAAS